MKTHDPRGAGTAARSFPSRVWSIISVCPSRGHILDHIAYLQDSLGGLLEDVLGEVWVVHRKTSAGEQTQQTLVLGFVDVTSRVSESGRVTHVNGDGVTVTKRWVWDQLVERRPAAAVST